MSIPSAPPVYPPEPPRLHRHLWHYREANPKDPENRFPLARAFPLSERPPAEADLVVTRLGLDPLLLGPADERGEVDLELAVGDRGRGPVEDPREELGHPPVILGRGPRGEGRRDRLQQRQVLLLR